MKKIFQLLLYYLLSRKMRPNQRVLTIEVTNNNPSNKQVTLFNSVEDLLDDRQSDGIIIYVQQAPNHSHVALKTELLSTYYLVRGAKYSATTCEQFNNEWFIQYADCSGHISIDKISPNNYLKANQEIATQRDMEDIELYLDGKQSLSFALNGGETVQIILFVEAKISWHILVRARCWFKNLKIQAKYKISQLFSKPKWIR